jgi:hypothetical protein
MFISHRGAFIKNVSLAIANSLITLTLLLIAPLGLAAVITNTIAVGISTFMIATFFDIVVLWLLEGQKNNPYLSRAYRQQPLDSIRVEKSREIEPKDDF